MVAFASGKYSVGMCQKCGLMFRYDELQTDCDTNLRVCEECFDICHPQEKPKKPVDPIALRKPSPETREANSEVVFPIYLVDLGTYFGQNLAQFIIGQPSSFYPYSGEIALSSATYTMDTGDTEVVVTAIRSISSIGTAYATYTVTDSHGVLVPVSPGQFTWGDGDSANKTLTLTRAQNCAYDVTVTLSDPSPSANLGSPDEATVSTEYDHSIPATDSNFASVVSLLHFNGSNGSTTYTDVIGKTWTGQGNAQISTAQSKFGGSSLLLDGNGDVIVSPDSADFFFSSGDFTIEGWINTSNTSTIPVFSQIVNTGLFSNRIMFGFWSGAWRMHNETTVGNLTVGHGAADSPPANTWFHVAFQRRLGVLSIYRDGMLLSGTTSANGSFSNLAASVVIGRITLALPGATIVYLSGYIDDFRITKGVGRYACNFTPPANQFRDS